MAANCTGIVLDEFKQLFRDEASYAEFAGCMKKASQHDLAAIFSGNELIGTFLSPQATKDVLYERMLKRIAEKPELLAEIASRLQEDDIVE